jgi:hypothetical protein
VSFGFYRIQSDTIVFYFLLSPSIAFYCLPLPSIAFHCLPLPSIAFHCLLSFSIAFYCILTYLCSGRSFLSIIPSIFDHPIINSPENDQPYTNAIPTLYQLYPWYTQVNDAIMAPLTNNFLNYYDYYTHDNHNTHDNHDNKYNHGNLPSTSPPFFFPIQIKSILWQKKQQ